MESYSSCIQNAIELLIDNEGNVYMPCTAEYCIYIIKSIYIMQLIVNTI